MLPRRVGIASRSATVGLRDLIKVAAALNVQANRDLQNIWNISATVTALADPESIEPGVLPIFIVDDVGQDGAAGLHLTDHKQPYALVDAGPTWSLTASHECLEMLVDPSGNRLVSSSAITAAGGKVQDVTTEKFEYLVEVADPSEDPANAYMIDEVLVSDFYTPHFFDPVVSPGVRYSFTGRIKRPREILPGGYISWLNPATGTMQQLRWFGKPEVIELPGQPAQSGRGTLRGFVDENTRPPCGCRVSTQRVITSLTNGSAPNGCGRHLLCALPPMRWPGVPAALQQRCLRPTPRKRCSTPISASFKFPVPPKPMLVGISKTTGLRGSVPSSYWRVGPNCRPCRIGSRQISAVFQSMFGRILGRCAPARQAPPEC